MTREKKDMTQEKTAELAGLHLSYFSKIERGLVNPSFYVLCQIASALDIETSKLISKTKL